MQQTCKSCSAAFEVTEDDIAFYDSVSPVINDRKFDIPPPTLCPECRQQRRICQNNEFTLYTGSCDKCAKSVITQFAPGYPAPVWCRECWLKDDWNPLDFGQDIDFDRSILEQFVELRSRVPAQCLDIDGVVQNCDYIHYAGHSKNCYIIMHADFCEDCMYGYGFKKNTSCVDGFYNLHCELCYDCVDIHTCYSLKGSQDCMNCSSSAFLRDCIGCKDCFCCTGLREKTYCFENEQLSKEEYQQKMAEIDLGSYEQYQHWKNRRFELEKKHTFKEYAGHNIELSLGDHLTNCKECVSCFDCEDGETLKYCHQLVLGAKNCMDMYQYGTGIQQSYEVSTGGDSSYHILFSNQIFNSSVDNYYCYFMESCKNMFACTLMRNGRNCILNKQYSEEEWKELVPKVIEKMMQDGEWGEFFPGTTSQFGYNETTAQMYYPLTKEEALAKGYKWCDYVQPDPENTKVIDADRLPDNIKDIPEDVLNWAIKSEETGKLFKLTAQEYKLYQTMGVPVPRRNWYQRHLDRFHLRNPRRFWKRNCGKCSKEIESTWDPAREETVYCEECYLATVY